LNLGVKEYYRDDDSIQVQGPGPHDNVREWRFRRELPAPQQFSASSLHRFDRLESWFE
jgi:hypothetical protein